MTRRNRQLERAAARLHEHFSARQSEVPDFELPTGVWTECHCVLEQVAKAKTHGWVGAARRTQQRLGPALQILLDRLTALKHATHGPHSTNYRPRLADIYRDLYALQDEFVDVQYDRRRDQLSVTTEEIVFDALNLGPFEIVLECSSLGRVSPYQVIALDANPAGTDSRTTHPHVQDDVLCAGEGHAAIERSLDQGRIFDFFLLVRQVLDTYNPSSAYVSINDWHGSSCRDCGTTMVDEDRDVCTRCEADLCVDCSYGCTQCSDRFCDDCTNACQACHDYYCHACLQTCIKCDLPYCEECLTNETCQKCTEKEEAEDQPQHDANASVHTVRVGEAALLS